MQPLTWLGYSSVAAQRELAERTAYSAPSAGAGLEPCMILRALPGSASRRMLSFHLELPGARKRRAVVAAANAHGLIARRRRKWNANIVDGSLARLGHLSLPWKIANLLPRHISTS